MAFSYDPKGRARHRSRSLKATLFLNKPFQPLAMAHSNHTGLPTDWAYSPAIDLELKQYLLLAYTQQVQARFKEHKLYPYLADVRSNADQLLQLQRSKKELARNLLTPLIGFDPGTGQPLRQGPEQPEPLHVIDEVLHFAIPKLTRLLEVGLTLRTELAQHVQFAPVGVQPLHTGEGWLLVRRHRETRAYAYTIPRVLEHDDERSHRSVHTRFVATYTLGLTQTFEHIKTDLIRRYPELPNPATFAVGTDTPLPCIETLMPLAKHLMRTHVSGGIG